MSLELQPDWPSLARRVARRIPRHRLHPLVLKHLEKLGRREPLAFALSGGADSVAALLCLYAHFPTFRNRLHVLHLNHGLRGEASNADEAFCRKLARGLGARFWSEKLEHAPGARPSEAQLREARLAFYQQMMRAAGCHQLVMGHQMNDITETFFMRLARGSGTAGLAAPRPVQKFSDDFVHLRPMLSVPRELILETLEDGEVPWREDESNGEDVYFRNRIRNKVLPDFIEASPSDALEGAAWARQQLEEDDTALQSWLDAHYPSGISAGRLDLSPLSDKPIALWRRALHRWLQANELSEVFGRSGFERMLEQVSSRSFARFSAGDDKFIMLRDSVLDIARPEAVEKPQMPAVSLSAGVNLYFPDGQKLAAHRVTLDDPLREGIFKGLVSHETTVFLDLPEDAVLTVRYRRPGDKYHALGAPGQRKLKDVLIDKKMALSERNNTPIVCWNDSPIWLPGLPPVEACRLNPEAKTALRLTYKRNH